MRRGFTLIEMLVVIGIIAILVGASISAYSTMSRRAARTHAVELVSNTAVALNVLFQEKGRWPAVMATEASGGDGRLTARAAVPLAENNLMSLTAKAHDENGRQVKTLTGLDRCGIVTPWAARVIKRLSSSAGALSAKVPPANRTVEKHILHFALDLDGDGITEAKVGGETIRVRANAVVWCIGIEGGDPSTEGDPWPYSKGLRRGEDIYSWNAMQVENR